VWSLAGLAAIFEFDQQETAGWIGIAMAAVLALLALATRQWLTNRLFLSHLLGIGVLLTVSSMLLAGGPTLLVALVAQAAATAVLARRFGDLLLGVYAAVLAVAAMSWGMGWMVIGLFDELTVGQHLANGSTVLLPIGLALVYRRQPRSAWFGGAVVVAWIMGLLWLASVLISLPQGQVLVSIVWAAAAAVTILLGVVRESGLARNLGLTTLAVVLLKLLTVDLAAVDTLWRVGLFFVIGSGLARLGYVLPRLGVQTPPDSTEARTPVV